jgi:hypothetical protein
MWIRLRMRGELSRLLLNAEVPDNLRAVSIELTDALLRVHVYTWSPTDERVKRLFDEEIIPRYKAEFQRIGIEGKPVEVDYAVYDGAGYIGAKGEQADAPPPAHRGQMVWFTLDMAHPDAIEEAP